MIINIKLQLIAFNIYLQQLWNHNNLQQPLVLFKRIVIDNGKTIVNDNSQKIIIMIKIVIVSVLNHNNNRSNSNNKSSNDNSNNSD